MMFGKCYNVRMPMLHGCAASGCETLTLTTYCYEHEQAVRAQIEAEQAQPMGQNHSARRESATAPRATA
jgi:hypothetical protein